MARKSRFNLVGIPQHVIQRGNNREPCFYSEHDYRHYLDELKNSASKYDCWVHVYLLMTNYVHVLVTQMKARGISVMMQAPARISTLTKLISVQVHCGRAGYKASLVDSDNYLLTCMRYFELNPVRANMVERPGEYKWSSYAAKQSNDWRGRRYLCGALVY
jgi:putative transposase